jgi:hypothetical protein
MLMTLHRDFVLSTLMGHSVRFEKGVPVDVPEVIIREAVAIGAVDAETAAPPNVIQDKTPDNAPADPLEREAQIYKAIKALVEKNDTDDFTAANAPKAAALSRDLGYTVERKEIGPLWQRYHDEKAGV